MDFRTARIVAFSRFFFVFALLLYSLVPSPPSLFSPLVLAGEYSFSFRWYLAML
jgi:hypothetical protein